MLLLLYDGWAPGEPYSHVPLQKNHRIYCPASLKYLTILRRDYLPSIRPEEFDPVAPLFPLEVVVVEAFYIVGYIPSF